MLFALMVPMMPRPFGAGFGDEAGNGDGNVKAIWGPASVTRLGMMPVKARRRAWHDVGDVKAVFCTGFGDEAQCGVGDVEAVFGLASVTRSRCFWTGFGWLGLVWRGQRVIPRPFSNRLRRRSSVWCGWCLLCCQVVC
jgi:hypothetical protein